MEILIAAGYIAKLIDTILLGIPLEQRQVTALSMFWIFWPTMKLSLPPDQAAAFEEVMKKIKVGN